MRERLTLDPVAESYLNQPLELTSPDDDMIVGLVGHAYPMPAVSLQTASSVDTDGEVVGSSRYSNREIPIAVDIVDPGLPEGENLAINPALPQGITYWAPSISAGGTQNVYEPAEMPDRPGEFGIHYNGTQPADTTLRGYGVTTSTGSYFPAVAGTDYTVGFDALVANTASGAGNGWRCDVVWYEVDETTVVSTSAGAIVDETVGTRQTIRETFTAPVGAVVGRLLARQLTNVSGDVVGAYYTRFLIVEATAGPVYFDGDTPGCYWTGARPTTSSIRTAGTDRLERALSDIEAKIAKFNRNGPQGGGTIRRELASGQAITFDICAATGFDATFDKEYDFGICHVSFTLQTSPSGRGDEIELTRHAETTLPYLEFIEQTVQGTVDPSASLNVENNDASADQTTVLIGASTRGLPVFYSAAGQMDPNTSISTLTTGTAGAYGAGSNVIKSTSGVTSSFGGEILASIDDIQNQGLYRAFARMRATGADVTMLMRYRAQGGLVRSRSVTLPATTWGLVDFGLVEFTTRENYPLGYIDFIGVSPGGSDLEINWLLLMPADVFYAELVGPIPPGGSATISKDRLVVNDGVTDTNVADYLGAYPELRVAASLSTAGYTQTIVKTCTGSRSGYFIEDAATDDIAATYTYPPRYLIVPRPE